MVCTGRPAAACAKNHHTHARTPKGVADDRRSAVGALISALRCQPIKSGRAKRRHRFGSSFAVQPRPRPVSIDTVAPPPLTAPPAPGPDTRKCTTIRSACPTTHKKNTHLRNRASTPQTKQTAKSIAGRTRSNVCARSADRDRDHNLLRTVLRMRGGGRGGGGGACVCACTHFVGELVSSCRPPGTCATNRAAIGALQATRSKWAPLECVQSHCNSFAPYPKHSERTPIRRTCGTGGAIFLLVRPSA